MLLNPEAVLLPLIDVKTGEAIESFPQDLEAFYQLDISEMLHILRALDTNTEKVGIVTVRETLRNAIM
ncbi:unnamed protein product [Clonostachys rosea f. rosea IK726]|uniref:Uncharacterized protein n=2 Tax=Bionectria ochroleuca TaxID=29856 RepID=A0A0B7JQ44_BIOOC|nr:unnamed protein product [Clonostachys rosea f. rosea IK726]